MSDPFAAPYKTNDGLPLTATIPVEDANTFYAGPIEGSPQQPTFRKIMAADLPGGTPIFGGFSVNGAMYANSTDTIASTLPGAQYTSLVSNGTSTAPTFQPISLDQPAGLSGILGQAQGGTGTNTSTAKTVFAGPVSGSNMLPTFRTLQQTDLPTINLSTSGAVSSQLPLANGGTAVDATNITQSYFFCGPENVPFISNPGPATFRAITINDVKDIASEIGLEMDSAAADYIVAKVNASASADNIAFRMSATGAATIASTMGVAGASTIAGNIPSTGADEIAGVMTSTGANSIAGKITSVGADAIAETMAGTGANIIAGNITSVGADAIAETMGQPGADIIGNNMSTIGAEHIATTMGTVGADIIGANLTPPYETTVTDVTTLQTDVTALQADVTTLQGDVTALDADVVSLDTSVAGLTTTVGGLTTSVAGLTTSVGVIEGEIVSINANLTILNAFQVTTQADLIDIYGQLGDQTGSGKIVKQRAPTITDSLLVTNDSLLGGIPPTINIYPQSGTAYDGYESHLYMANNTSVNYPSSINVTMGIGGNSSGSRYRQKFFVLAPQMYIDAPVTITTPLGISSGGTGLSSTSQSYTLVGPVSGSGAPTWRQLTYADISGGSSPSFSGLTANGVIYAVNSTSVASTSAGSQYQAMIANSSGAPTFQALALNQSAAVSGTLAVSNGGTGTTTSTGTGSTVLSASPSLTGSQTITTSTNVASLVINTNASVDTIQVTSTNTAKQASIQLKNDLGNSMFIIQGGSTNGAPYTNQSVIVPSANGLFINGTLKILNALGVAYGGTGTTTSTGTGSVVLSASPTLTGTVTVTGGASTALAITSTNSTDPVNITNTNSAGPASISFTNDTGKTFDIGVYGSTMTNGGQPFINLVNPLHIYNFTANNVMYVQNTGTVSAAAGACVYQNNSTQTLTIGVGSTGHSTFPSQAFITTSTGSVQMPITINATALALTTALPVTSGGTGVTTSTGTGSNVLSASPTFTGTIAAAALTLSIPLAISSGGTGLTTTSQSFVLAGPVATSGAPTWRQLTYADIAGGSSPSFSGLTANGVIYAVNSTSVASTTAGSQYQSMIANATGAPTFQALALNQSAAVSGTLAVANGGTGTTTSTGTGSNVLSASPSLTGSETITTTTNVPSLSITTNAVVDTIQVTSSNTATQASLKLTNDLGNSSYWLQGGSTNLAPYTNQTVIVPSANGLFINGTLKLLNSLGVAYGGTGLSSTSQNFAFIGPTSGSGAPTWRALVAGDIPTISLTSGVSGTLPVANGGTGVTTSTGTGSVVLSASPTFTGTIAAAAMTLSTPLAVTSGGTGVTTSTGTGSNVLSASPTFTGTIAAAALTLSTPLAVTSGGTGTTTSTGSGSVVLSASPTLTGSETITTTTNVGSLVINTNASVDSIQVTSSNTAKQASMKLTNDLGNSSYFIQGGSTNTAPYTDQTVIAPSAKGLVIKSHVSLGDSPSGNPTNCLSINNTGSSNSINVTCNNANTYNSIQFYNDTSSLAEFGVGGSTVGATQDRNRAFISANSLVINCPLIQSSSLMTVYTNFSSVGGFAGGYQNSLFTGSTQTNYGSLTPITSGTGARQMPVSGIYTFSYSWVGGNTNNLVFFISKNGVAYDPGNAATSPDLLGFSWQQIGTITATVYMNTTDTIAFQQYSPNTTLYPYGGFGENQCRMTLVMQTS